MEDFNQNLDNVTTELNLFGERVEKLSIKDRIGFLPISVWRPDWQKTKRLKDEIGDDASHRTIRGGKDRGGKGYRVTTTSYKTCMGGAKQSDTSVFNPHLAQMILSAYCPSEAKIYNPFSGDWAMGFVAAAMGHDYTGVEIRQDEVDAQIRRQQELHKQFKILCDDATTYDIDPDYYDFSYTCPPYYDLEIYSDLSQDLSTIPTYEQFLQELKKAVAITYKGIKKDCLSVWVVGNFRDKSGELRHFNGDLVRIAKQVGFKLWDELIFWGASGAASMRCGQFEANRKSIRVHEYVLIFKK